MAEIKIEKKKPVWPWIILGLIILVLVYFLAFQDGTEGEQPAEDITTEEVSPEQTPPVFPAETGTSEIQRPESVERYLAHIGDETRMGIEHEYTNNALLLLIDAVQAKADKMKVDIDADLQEARKHAGEITKNPAATNHANKIKAAGKEIVKAMEKIRKERYPELVREVGEAKKAVENIDPEVLTLEQKNEINYFFISAGNALRKMH